MTTIVSALSSISTLDENHQNESNDCAAYRYAPPGTVNSNRFSTQDTTIEPKKDALDIKPCITKRNLVMTSFDNKIERIKQRWNGVIVDYDDTEITARIEDLIHPDNSDELVTFLVEEIEPRDQPLIKIGAMFLWQIGYRYGPKYPRERFSKISFRRLSNWTEEEIKHAETQAKEYANYFLANPNNSP